MFEQVKSKFSPKTHVDPELKKFEQGKAENSLKSDNDLDLNRLEQGKTQMSPKTDVDSGDDDLVVLSRNNTPEDEFFDASRSLSKLADSKAPLREFERTPTGSPLDQGTKDYDGEIQSAVSDPQPRKHRRNKDPGPRRSSGNADRYESPSEDARSIAASAPVSNDVDEGGRTRRKSKRRSSDIADSASLISSSRKHADSADSHSKGKKEKKGLFGFLNRSSENPSESPRTKEKSTEATADDFEDSKRSKDSKDRRSSRHGSRHRSRHGEDISNDKADSHFPQETFEDDYEGRLYKSKGRKDKRRSTGGSTTNDSGRISQDLPAKVYSPASTGRTLQWQMLTYQKGQETSVLDKAFLPESGERSLTKENKQIASEDSQPMSFLGMRPEIPPLPDSPDASDFPKSREDKEVADIFSSSLQDLTQRDVFSSEIPPFSHSPDASEVPKSREE